MTKTQIALAPLDSTDMALCRAWRNDWKVWRWCRQLDLISDAEQHRWFQAQSTDPTIRMYKVMGITPDATGPVGVCGLTSISHVHRTAEFSLYVAPEAQGKGLGTKALSLLLMHGFENLGLNVIWGESFDGNPAIRIFERLGFVKEGTRRQLYWKDGAYTDAHLYSITAEEWRAASRRLDAASAGGDASDCGDGAPPISQYVPDPREFEAEDPTPLRRAARGKAGGKAKTGRK